VNFRSASWAYWTTNFWAANFGSSYWAANFWAMSPESAWAFAMIIRSYISMLVQRSTEFAARPEAETQAEFQTWTIAPITTTIKILITESK
jgi:hypothetical protein